MQSKEFNIVWADAQNVEDRDAFVSDWALSSLFNDPDQEEHDIDNALIEELGNIWDVAHMSIKDMKNKAGLTNAGFSERFCIGRRTVETWMLRDCSNYNKLMVAECLGFIKRQ